MPDAAPVADASLAGSSPAPDATPIAPSPVALESLTETQLHDWKMTGALPDSTSVTTPPADSSPATPGSGPAGSTDPLPQSAASAAAATRKGADARIPELLADRAKERARAEAAERRLLELERAAFGPPPRPDARPAASSPAPAPDDGPDPDTFPYGTSDPAYLKALAAHTVAHTLGEERQKAAALDQGRRIVAGFQVRADTLRQKYPDFDAVALHTPTDIRPGSVVDRFVLEHAAGADVLYHLHQPANAGERARILGMRDELAQTEALIRLGDRLTQPAGARSTHAPDPPVVLPSRATPGDAVERALAADDTGAYLAEMNRRDMARLRR
jgi:hypothetical protein